MVITIRDQIVEQGKKKMPIDKFCGLVQQHCVSGLRDEPIPDHVRWIVESGRHAVYILELQPELRTVLWVDDPECTGDGIPYTIATPYVVLQVPFHENGIYCHVRVFYRNQPLQSIDDELYHTNLHNINSGLCLDGLKYPAKSSRAEVLGELVNHLWSGEFNRETGNLFELFAQDGNDQRLTSIENWQKASQADPKFVLGVNWFPVQMTVKQCIQSHLSIFCPQFAISKQLGNLILKDC